MAFRRQNTVLIGEDCPAFEGLFEFCSISAGGSLSASIRCVRRYFSADLGSLGRTTKVAHDG